jgi:uncharacterized DUF497 family protein
MTEAAGNPHHASLDCEWDDAKAAPNIVKHGIDFLDAAGALSDPRRVEDIDEGFAYDEERTRTIGMTRSRILFVVTTT